ncbi:MAG: DNA cytosine methyltransferase [Planctomycetota bacterium]|nr:DNA cytosine methyltransferase [Planctomycetota bacterium]
MKKSKTLKGARRSLAISLFSGAGGMDIGVEAAGFEVLVNIEQDEHCCETLRAAVSRGSKQREIIESDIHEVDPEALRIRLKLEAGDLDLLFGGPPCQTFSAIGKKEGIKDKRGRLVFQMARFARAFRPKFVLMEQVKGFLTAKGLTETRGEVFEELKDEFQSIGYVVEHSVLNAADFGVPQLRKRLFIVAAASLDDFDFPTPTHQSAKEKVKNKTLTRPLHIPIGDVIAGLGSPSHKSEGARTDSHIDCTPAGDKRRIKGVLEGAYLASQFQLPAEQRGRLSKKDTTKFLRLSRLKPSNTLRCGEIFFHPLEDRYLTPREYMRIHCYPDDYLLKGPVRGRSGRVKNLDQHRQVANSVPPPLAEALAHQIERALAATR